MCPVSGLSIASESTALRFASPTASVGRQDAFDPLPSPISLPSENQLSSPWGLAGAG